MIETLQKKANQSAKAGQLEQAKKLCRKILSREANRIETLILLGSIYLVEKDYEKSRTLFKQILSLNPNHPDALNYLGMVCLEHDRDTLTAGSFFKRVSEIDPAHVNGLVNLGITYLSRTQNDEAENIFHKVLAIDPNNVISLNNLGVIASRKNKPQDVMKYYRQALSSYPDNPDILSNLLIWEKLTGNKKEMLKLTYHIVSLPHPGLALFTAYASAKNFCLWEEAKKSLPEIMKLISQNSTTISSFENINLLLLATVGISHASLLDVHKMTGKTIEALRERPAYETHEEAMHPTPRWRVGYLSPDFRRHSVSTFVRGLINNHDRDRFEVYCYSSTKLELEDDITAQYREAADIFVNVSQLSDRQLAERIHSDGIHFLLDLAGYTQHGRLGALSYRPAPVQMMYIGYPYTSGLPAVDYFVTDPYMDGPDNAKYFTEQQLRLPHISCTMSRLFEQAIEKVIPFERNRFITFGSLNSTYKLSPELIYVWSQILKRIPDSRMIINHPNCEMEVTRINILKEFSKHGIDGQRIDIVWKTHPKGSYLRYYNDIDIMLDTFPLTGGTTTMDALWMGVSVVTLVGDICPHRISYSVLSNIGIDLKDLIAFSEEEYVEKAVALASNPARIAELHRTIPESLSSSVLCDPIHLTKQVEAAYIEGWKRKFPESPVIPETKEKAVQYIPVRGGVDIAVEGTLEEINTYILREQEGWFDPEHGFVLNLIQPGMQLLDICTGVGAYAIPLAKKVGGKGRLWATTKTEKEARFMEKSKAHNALDNLCLMVKGDRTLFLDSEMKFQGLKEIDFVRISTNATDTGFLQSGKRFFSQNSPLIMFGIRRDNQIVDTQLVSEFKQLEYHPYRLVPGVNLLLPFTTDEDLDVFAVNLFFCKGDRADLLEKQGVLVRKAAPASDLPGTHIKDWQGYLKSFPYASALIEHWITVPSNLEEWESYWIALNLYARAKDAGRTAEVRYASLETSYGILVMLAKAKATLPRLLSLSRVMIELGKRESAVHLLNQIFALFEKGGEIEINEPFLPLSDEYAAIDPGERLAEWLFASILDQREKARAFSSYFTGEESLPTLEAIYNTGFFDPEIERRIKLIKERYQNVKISSH